MRAAPSATIDPRDAGIDVDALEVLRTKVRAEVDAGRLPAAQLALAVDGQLAVFESFGAAEATTRFAVFSCTKALVAGAVWQLLAEGSLHPWTRVVEVLPRFGQQGRTPGRMAQVTLEHLLTHTSGFPYAPLGPPQWDSHEGRVEAMAGWHAPFEPGTHFEYHPTAAHWVVAAMMEVVEGRDHRDVVRDRVIEPLGLSSFGFGVPPGDQADITPLRVVGDPPGPEEIAAIFGTPEVDLGEVTPDVLESFNNPYVRSIGIPGGGAVANAADLALLYQAMLDDRAGLWDPEVLADATGRIRCTLPNPATGVASNRTLGLVMAGDDGLASFRGMGPTVSPGTFGHNGAGGQIAWGDPATGLSFGFTTSAIERNMLLEARRILSITAKAGLCRPWAS